LAHFERGLTPVRARARYTPPINRCLKKTAKTGFGLWFTWVLMGLENVNNARPRWSAFAA
jgi:hypothetical protein